MAKVLVIEDEPRLQKVVKVNLTASGYTVLAAENGEEGLKLAEKQKPDLILLDIKMPGMSGWEVLKALRARPDFQKVPVIIMTAFLREDEKAQVGKLDAQGFLVKPFDAAQLLAKVKQALGGGT